MMGRMTGYWMLTALLVLLLSGCGPCMMHHRSCGEGCRAKMGHQGPPCATAPCQKTQGMMMQATESTRRDVLYHCNCGPDCTCNSVGVTPGNCACGKPMAWSHVVRVEGDEALLCTCKEGCQCRIDPNDASKCGCGNAVKRVSLKGSGLYFCNCGGACGCNTLSTEPARCRCGMQLKKAQ